MHHLQFYHLVSGKTWNKFLVILRQWISGEHPRNLLVPVVPNVLLQEQWKHCLACFAVSITVPATMSWSPMAVLIFRGIQRGSNEVKKFLLQLLHPFWCWSFITESASCCTNGHSSHHLYHGASPWMCKFTAWIAGLMWLSLPWCFSDHHFICASNLRHLSRKAIPRVLIQTANTYLHVLNLFQNALIKRFISRVFTQTSARSCKDIM